MEIILADGQRIFREATRALLSRCSDMRVEAEAASGRELFAHLRRKAPHLVLLDTELSDLEGPETVRRIHQIDPRCRVVALSDRRDPALIEAMLEAGALGYILKDSSSADLLRGLRAVHVGDCWLSPGAARALLDGREARQQGQLPPPSPLARLSRREREVFRLVVAGRSSREIASRLHVSVKTVDTHRHNLGRKLGVKSVAELVVLAIREGVISVNGR